MSGAEERAALRWLSSERARETLAALFASPVLLPKTLTTLRRQWGPARAARLIAAASLRERAAEKFGSGKVVFATDRALQQSTDQWIARYKASRFPVDVPVVDVCCGIGGDLAALAARGPVIGVDADPAMCIMAAQNLAGRDLLARGCRTQNRAAVLCQQAETLKLPEGVWLHVDPDRRGDQSRTTDPEFCRPPVDVLDRLLEQADGTAIKLAPAADIPGHWGERAVEREWISRGGSCRQQVVWFRRENRATISATVVDTSGGSQTFSTSLADCSQASIDEAGEPNAWLLDFDPAVRAAGLSLALAEQLSLQSVGGPAGFFTSDDLPPATTRSGDPVGALVSPFRVLWWGAMDEKQLRRQIQAFAPRSLEIKVRGLPLRPEILRPKLLKGPRLKAMHAARRGGPHRDLVLLIGRRSKDRSGYAAVAERPGAQT